MRWFLIIANFMAPRAVLILLGVPLPILSFRHVFFFFETPSHKLLYFFILSLPVLLCCGLGVISDFIKRYVLYLIQDMRSQLSKCVSLWHLLFIYTCCQFKAESPVLCFIWSSTWVFNVAKNSLTRHVLCSKAIFLCS